MLTLDGSFNNNFSGCEVKQEIILPLNDSTSEFSPHYLNLDKPANLDHKNGNKFPYHRHIVEGSYIEVQNLQRQLGNFNNSTSTSIKNSNPLSPPSESTLTTLDDKHASSVLIPSTANTTISVKRGRTSFTSAQLVQLKKEFSRSKYVSKKRREEIAQELNLAEIQIKIWFQNQRRKYKSTKNQTKRPETPSEDQLNPNKPLMPILGIQQEFPSYNQTDFTPAVSPQSFATSVESFSASPEPYTPFSETFTPTEYCNPSEELNIDYRHNFSQPQYFQIGNPFSPYSSNSYYNHKFMDFNFREFYGTQGVAIEYLPNQNFDFSQNKPVMSANPIVNIPWYGQQYCGNY